MEVVGLAAHRPRRRQPARARQSRRRRARYRNAGARRHLGAAAAAAKKRDLVVIMASTLTRRNAEISFKALSLGAADYIPKPESTREATAAETFRHELIQKIRHLGAKAAAPLRAACVCRESAAGAGPPTRAREATARPAAAPAAPAATGAPAVQHAGAARAADRLVDRRPAGADDAGRRDRPGDRSFSGADHPAHAADLHHHSRRASGAREPPAGA